MLLSNLNRKTKMWVSVCPITNVRLGFSQLYKLLQLLEIHPCSVNKNKYNIPLQFLANFETRKGHLRTTGECRRANYETSCEPQGLGRSNTLILFECAVPNITLQWNCVNNNTKFAKSTEWKHRLGLALSFYVPFSYRLLQYLPTYLHIS